MHALGGKGHRCALARLWNEAVAIFAENDALADKPAVHKIIGAETFDRVDIKVRERLGRIVRKQPHVLGANSENELAPVELRLRRRQRNPFAVPLKSAR